MSDHQDPNTPEAHGWAKTSHNDANSMEHYERDNVDLDFSPTTRTVETTLVHPKQGKTQLIRHDLSEETLQRVLDNPRYHTGQGYKRR